MSKFKTFLKNHILTKKFGYIAFSTLGTIALVSLISYKFAKRFKPTFYNYKSYIANELKEKISEKYDFKEFDTLSQFTRALLTKKAVAGIGSDAQVVQLIKWNQLKKIDYNYILKLGFDENDFKNGNYDDAYQSKLESKLKNYFTPLVWEHLQQYDKDLLTDYDANGLETIQYQPNENNGSNTTKRHLWEYFVPYFAQDMVIAYNPSKGVTKNKSNASINYDLENKIYSELAHKGRDLKMIDILQTLKSEGFNNWEITDSVRDNMIYGSGYRIKTNTKERTDTEATGSAYDNNEQIYPLLIRQFRELIKNGTGFDTKNSHINFIGDGGELLNNLISEQSPIQVGVIYNGDALDAFLSKDNNDNYKVGTIRFLRPKINLLLVDGFVLSKQLKDNDYYNCLDMARETFLNGLDQSDDNWKNENQVEKYGAYKNFDFVNYTPAFKKVFDYVKENYFKNIANANPNPLNNSDYGSIYQEDWMKNYNPKYELEYLKNLYEISNNYKISSPSKEVINYNVNHIAVKPVNQKIGTEINRFWSETIKK